VAWIPGTIVLYVSAVGLGLNCWQFVLCTCFNGTYVVTQNSSVVAPGVPQETMRYTTSVLVALCPHLVPSLLLYYELLTIIANISKTVTAATAPVWHRYKSELGPTFSTIQTVRAEPYLRESCSPDVGAVLVTTPGTSSSSAQPVCAGNSEITCRLDVNPCSKPTADDVLQVLACFPIVADLRPVHWNLVGPHTYVLRARHLSLERKLLPLV
jgi:hypothetical protein